MRDGTLRSLPSKDGPLQHSHTDGDTEQRHDNGDADARKGRRCSGNSAGGGASPNGTVCQNPVLT